MARRSRSYVNLDENPIRAMRKSLDLTLTEASVEADVNLQTWYLTERGACRNVPQGIFQWLRSKFADDPRWGHNILQLDKEFQDFQIRAREAFWEVHGEKILSRFESQSEQSVDRSGPINFLETLLSATNCTPTEFAKNLCISPTVVAATLNGRRQKLPREVTQALVSAGWPPEQLANTGVRF